MAEKAATGLVPFSMQAGRIDDFLTGMRESHDESVKGLAETVGIIGTVMAWPALRRYMREH